MALKRVEKKDAVYSIVSLFIWGVMLPSIHLSVHPKTVRRVWYFVGRVYTWLVPRKWRSGGGKVSSTVQENAVRSSTFLSTCLAARWLCLLMGHHEYALMHAFPCLGFQAPPQSWPHSSAFVPPESKRAPYDKVPYIWEPLRLPGRKTQAFWLGFYCSGHL